MCGIGALWLIVTVGAFESSLTTVAYVLGFTLAGVAILVSAMDICIPSMIFRAIFGPPLPRPAGLDASEDEVAKPPLNRRDRDRLYRW